jgi:RNA polymerase sigma-70 factor (ECF subfamily)
MTGPDFESIVAQFYQPLYKFAFSLTRTEADSCDLTQQTFYLWATKGHQLRDPSKVKTWLFTTLYRAFLESRRTQNRFPHHELDESDDELPMLLPALISRLDWSQAVQALGRVDEVYQAPVALFYLEERSYKEIAQILDIPMGTVKSRMTRGLTQLKQILIENTSANQKEGGAA